MDYKYMPFYMQSYNMEMLSQEASERRDIEYIKRMYPKQMRELQDIVEEECDRLEYEGSFMYDEYPDKIMLGTVVGKIVDKVNKNQKSSLIEELETMQYGTCNGNCPPPGPHPGPDPRPPYPENRWLRDVVEVLLYNEMFRRRCSNRRCRRWY
ncbi:MAG: hypothetical protein ACI4DS_05770 [Eubacterium sp.]